MLSAGYLAIAVVDFAVLIWAAGHCLRYRTNGLIFASLPLTLLWYDNLVVGLGSTLGEGGLLMNLNTVRFLGHYNCRTGSSGSTLSVSSAALSVMRRAPQLGQKPRRLQLKATSRSAWQVVQRTRRKPCSSRPHFR